MSDPTKQDWVKAEEALGSNPAFPNQGDGPRWDGLTRRELFAAMAMQGMLASWPADANLQPKKTAAAALAFADALIAELNTPETFP